ncbi:MAG: 50S ribosomal protein L29 [Candidatus Magasanikbacteria bacterium]|uniref:Large ribosomal subunit protein uL29 n=1 Tax=Candidatus Magasanikbacteria bacterium CG10_big_fil_rev_8_21_14_0_10_38_6 TaxID=1974647 RepID=A0A2M6P0P1_9BACT|nr:50S ribosomal protein L29 [Candidatus Magasanikbacteria bacterium]NCS71914.1 50S ribosomal protein L29 [Candidatus Magasanikbacteria bacterium]PIR77129.1 MAG: 50S ribosomal protein L29 [Candidatus Magasanikbacteria bacterium CG10_big_fil_rev_8_21_14_0_10_38_6]
MTTITELQEKTVHELHDLLAQKRDKVRELRNKASENQLKDVRSLRNAKKTIAKIMTLLNQPTNN